MGAKKSPPSQVMMSSSTGTTASGPRRSETFRPAFHELTPAFGIHAKRKNAAPAAAVQRHVREAQLFREPEVFEDAAFHGFMAADPLVGRAVNQQKLAEQTPLRIPVAEQRKSTCASQHHQVEEGGELLVKIADDMIAGSNQVSASRNNSHSPVAACAP
jgi:hypothetical protein